MLPNIGGPVDAQVSLDQRVFGQHDLARADKIVLVKDVPDYVEDEVERVETIAAIPASFATSFSSGVSCARSIASCCVKKSFTALRTFVII